jgi:ABC-type multidrug transport system fused ATPase/permease subunit
MASKISKECSAVSRGIGEKVSHVIGGILSMGIGFFVAFFYCYQFTLLLFAFMPFLMFTTILMSLAFKR